MSKEWQSFWNGYRNVDAHSEDDLFVQVGKTIAKQPIPRDMFDRMIASIGQRLELSPTDRLLDLCCGNGLVTIELAPRVAEVVGVDFAEHLIATARKFKSRANITYRVADVCAPLDALMGGKAKPDKILMNDALAYFEPSDLERLLANVVTQVGNDPFSFLLTGIPSDELKWNFYDTPARRARHAENERSAGNTNDGLGRWWRAEEIASVCSDLGLALTLTEQPASVSNYRMDALVRRD